MANETILVVDDEPSFADALVVGLTREGYSVAVASDGGEALEKFAELQPDLVLLDVMLPVMSGIDVCRTIRQTSLTPIIMVSAKGEEADAVIGLEVGADDYVTKPYGLRELVARVRSNLRRAAHSADVTPLGEAESVSSLVLAGVELDSARHEVSVRGVPVQLPLKEFELLSILMENAGRVLTREILMDRVWGYDYVGETKTLDVHIKRLRNKIEVDPRKPELITTIRGLGYKFTD